MSKLERLAVLAAASAGMLLLQPMVEAAAAAMFSSYATYSYDGKSYRNQAHVANRSGSNLMYSGGHVERRDKLVDTRMKLQTNLYKNGGLCGSFALKEFKAVIVDWNFVEKTCGYGSYTARGSSGAVSSSGTWKYWYTNTAGPMSGG